MGIAVEGGNVSACFSRPHEIGAGYDHIRLRGYPGDLKEHIYAVERAFKVGFCVLGPFSRRGYRDAVFTDGTDDFHVGPYVAVRGIFYCRDGNFVRGVIFARKAFKRLVFDAQTHALDYVIVPGRVGSIRPGTEVESFFLIHAFVFCVNHERRRGLGYFNLTAFRFHYDFQVGIHGSVHIVDEVAAHVGFVGIRIVFGGDTAVGADKPDIAVER